MKKRTQRQRIIDYLARGRTLTPLEAWRRFGTERLAARVHELKGEGHDITSKLVKRGEAYVAQYRLERSP